MTHFPARFDDITRFGPREVEGPSKVASSSGRRLPLAGSDRVWGVARGLCACARERPGAATAFSGGARLLPVGFSYWEVQARVLHVRFVETS